MVKFLLMKVSSSEVVGRAQPAKTLGMTQVKCLSGDVGLQGFGLGFAVADIKTIYIF